MTPSTSRRIHALSAFSLIGLGISIYQTVLFYSIREGTAGFKSACNLGQGANCDVILASAYAEFVGGIPLSSYGAAWFLSIFIMTFFARNPYWIRDSLRVILGMFFFSAVLSAYFFFIMAGVMKTYCVYCLGVDACVVLGLLTTLSLKSEWSGPVKLDLQKLKMMGLTLAGTMVVAMLLLTELNPSKFSQSDMAGRVDQILTSPVLAVGSGDEFSSIGPANSPITIVEFSDFQCPYCRIGAVYLNTVMNRYPGKIRLVFRNYPIDPSCNPKVQHSMHPVACEAAKAGLCARKQGKFEAVYEQFFENQASFATSGDGTPEAMAAKAGVDVALLKTCTASPDIQLAISKDVEEGTRLGVESTPTFFINGHKVEGAYPIPAWNMMVDRLLAGK